MSPAQAELDFRNSALSAHERRRNPYLDQVRAAMLALYESRRHMVALHNFWALDGHTQVAYVTADDARRAFDALRPDPSISRNCLGAVFLAKGWVKHPTIRVKSATKGSHANDLPAWVRES